MRLPALALPLLALLLAGCRSATPYVAPDVPEGAAEVVLTDDEMPRVLYASAWGAFARFGWRMAGANPDALRFTVEPPEGGGARDVYAEEQIEGGRLGTGRRVARPVPDAPDARALLQAAAEVLATVPGRLSVR